jgi:hypothetical protein
MAHVDLEFEFVELAGDRPRLNGEFHDGPSIRPARYTGPQLNATGLEVGCARADAARPENNRCNRSRGV